MTLYQVHGGVRNPATGLPPVVGYVATDTINSNPVTVKCEVYGRRIFFWNRRAEPIEIAEIYINTKGKWDQGT